MKKLNMLMIAALAACSLQACHSNTQNDSKAAADSANEKKDSSKKEVSSSAPASQAIVDKDDAKFATEAVSGGIAEVLLGKLAQEKGSSDKVKNFGTMMVTDHSKANDELKTLALSKNITLPVTPDTDEQKHIDDLSKKTGADFDNVYTSMMIDDHKNDIKLFEDAEKNLKDTTLKAFATKTLPTLKLHLKAINKVSNAIKI